MPQSLNNRVTIITGASAGIGEALARDLAARGSRLILNARRKERLDALAAELNTGGPKRAIAVAGDTSLDSTITAMLDAARPAFGAEADAVIVNAGRGLSGSLLTSDPTQWEEMIRTNLLGAASLMRAAAQRMLAAIKAGGDGAWLKHPHDIVVIGSTVGRHISPFSSAYGSTKFGVHSLAEALRREIGPSGVRVTLVEPGVVKSEFQQVAGYDPTTFGAFMDKIGPVLDPADVARSIAFILEQPPGVTVSNLLVRPTRQDYP